MSAIAKFIAFFGLSMFNSISRSGGRFGAGKAYERACDEFHAHGQTSLRIRSLYRLLRSGSIDVDRDGFTLNRRRLRARFAWTDIAKPFALERTARTYDNIVFYVRTNNKNFGKRRIFGNTRAEFIDKKWIIFEPYEIGQVNLVEFLNKLRENFSMPKVSDQA